MLPRSLFSASTFKTDKNASSHISKETNDDSSEDELLFKPKNITDIPQILDQLKSKLKEQYSQQEEYHEKLTQVNQSIKQTSDQVTYYANLLYEQSQKQTALSEPFHHERAPSSTDELLLNRRLSTEKPLKKRSSTERPLKRSLSTEKEKDVKRPQLAKRSSPLPPIKNPTQVHYEKIPWGERNTMDVYTLRKREHDTAFLRKPRSLLFGEAHSNSNKCMSNLMVSTSIGGDVQFWDIESRKKIKEIGKDYLYDGWIEDICWLNSRNLVISPSKPSQEPVKTIRISDVTKSTVKGNVYSVGDSPHENGISVIGSMNSRGNEDASRFLTGGYDRQAYLWTLKRDESDGSYTKEKTTPLGISHTSAITAFSYNEHSNTVIVGGQDERISVLDLEKNQLIRTNRTAGRISQFVQSSLNPNIILVARALTNDQFQIYDTREPERQEVVLRFGQIEKENLSRYVKPDFHKNGYMVACGSQESTKINFWDLRYSGVSKQVSFSMEANSPKILITKFIPGQDTIVTGSSTRVMTWLDYSVRKDEEIKGFLL